MSIKSILPSQKPVLSLLTEIHKVPKQLYYLGNLDNFAPINIAIVGSRRPTAYGREVAHRLAYDLTQAGVNIISGLAFGIDAIAHQACLEAGGKTIAVLASGLDNITPRSNQNLADRILQNEGAIISEYPVGTIVKPHNFLVRNRIVSGLSTAIVVIEASQRSGTLSTAAHALRQNREVFAVPGNITSLMSIGCNQLIKQGATPITSAQNVLDIILPTQKTTIAQKNSKDPIEQAILELLAQGQRDGDLILQEIKIDPADFNYALTMLELKGDIKSLGANKWMIA